jgi:repressor LexA
MPQLSPKQLEVLGFIRDFIEAHGFPPTRGEIAKGLGLKNRQGIDQHLRALEMKGAIELIPEISRGIRLRDPSTFDMYPHRSEAAFFSDASHKPQASSPSLPLLGRIAAGSPILATENIEEQVPVDAAMFRPRADFLLRVQGDSMRDANILDRDLLAVHRTTQVSDGQIVVARIDDEATVKYYRKQGQHVRLEPANPDYAPIDVDLSKHEMTIEGLAVGVIRRELGIRSR